MGQRDIRRLLITGAMVIVRWACRKGAQEGTWLHRMLGRKPRMLVAIALANKMARSIWAMLTKGEDYRGPPPPLNNNLNTKQKPSLKTPHTGQRS